MNLLNPVFSIRIKISTLVFLFLLLTSFSLGQSICELEEDLSRLSSTEKYGDKIEKARKLLAIDPFNYKAAEYICRYYNDREIDSVSTFFDILIAKFPNNPNPYLLRSELLYLEHNFRGETEYKHLEAQYLHQALSYENSNRSALYSLAKMYYEDFIYSLEEDSVSGFVPIMHRSLQADTSPPKEIPPKKSVFKSADDSALFYFYKLWALDTDRRDVIYYPIRQLEYRLNRTDKSLVLKEAESMFNACFFSSWYFANLKEDWACDSTINYLYKIESAKREAEWLSLQLSALGEKCIYNAALPAGTVIYRFTWLRSFDHPICIRMEKTLRKVTLYWEEGKGAGGYPPKGLKQSGKKRLRLRDWQKFQQLVNESGFDHMPHKKYIIIADGATWTLERKTLDSYKAYSTNIPYDICLYLLKKTNIHVKEKDVY